MTFKVEVDLSRDALFDELGLQRLKESYMKDDERVYRPDSL